MCSPKVSKYALQQTGKTSSMENKEIMRPYLIIVQYSTGDIFWPNPSIGIVKSKSWACVACKYPKTAFYFASMSNCISMSWALLLKRALVKTCRALGGDNILVSKTTKIKVESYHEDYTGTVKTSECHKSHYLSINNLVIP